MLKEPVGGERLRHALYRPDQVLTLELVSLRADVDSLTDELLNRYEEITLLYDLGHDMGTVLDFEEASRTALARSLQVIPAGLGLVLLGDRPEALEVVVDSGMLNPDDARYRIARAAAAEAMRNSSQVMWMAGETPGGGDAIAEPVLAAPLRVAGNSTTKTGMAGVLAFVGHNGSDRFSAAEAQLCAVVAGQLGQGMRNARAINQLREKERLEADLSLAASVQRSLLPARPPAVAGVKLAAACIPAAQVGGDYYDFLPDADGGVSVVVADVAGHGLGPGLIMAMTRSVLRAELRRSGSLTDVLQATNAVMWDDLVATEAFITLFVGRYEPTKQQLRYVNAGHQPALLRHADGTVKELDSDGMPFGILASPRFEEKTEQLASGDLLLIFSDGVVDASSPMGVAFGSDGLKALLAAGGSQSADQTVTHVLAHLAGLRADGSQDDDITLVGLHVLPTSDGKMLG